MTDGWGWIRDLLGFDEPESPTHGAVQDQTHVVAAQADSDGEVAASTDNVTNVYDYIAAPKGGATGVPAGSTLIDFFDGVMTNSEMSEDVTEFEPLAELSGADNLRSCALYIDVPAAVDIDGGDSFEVESGLQFIEATKFQQIRIVTDAPARIAAIASTRSTPMTTTNGAFVRAAQLEASTPDAYQSLDWTTPETATREGDYSTHADATIPVDGRESTVSVENTSGNENAVDVRLVARTAKGEPFQTVAEVLGLADGDHHVFNVQQQYHTDLQVQVRNNTDGQTVSGAAQFRGEDN
ncbi:hypothetical protein [Haloarchaeobius sp. DFWS5]|uniref:hypothetical protein n=1 Tax=Haloarchaeobius sp. DFWS5 TaxID=3446114 RepID=UPI003EBCD520